MSFLKGDPLRSRSEQPDTLSTRLYFEHLGGSKCIALRESRLLHSLPRISGRLKEMTTTNRARSDQLLRPQPPSTRNSPTLRPPTPGTTSQLLRAPQVVAFPPKTRTRARALPGRRLPPAARSLDHQPGPSNLCRCRGIDRCLTVDGGEGRADLRFPPFPLLPVIPKKER